MAKTTKEALFAELLGDMDKILTRVEALPALLGAAEKNISRSVEVMNEASEKYRQAVAFFTEQAKTDLTAHFDQTADKVAMQQFALFQAAIRKTLQIETGHSKWSRLGELAVTGFFSAAFTSIIVFFLLR